MGRRKKNRVVLLEDVAISGFANKGRCAGRTPEGMVVFVERTVPGDVVDVRVTKKKNGFFEGYPLAFKTLSSERTEPFCAHFGVCGGCKYQNLPYEVQLKYKQEVVEQAIRRIGKLSEVPVLPILGSAKTRFYRNKLDFSFSNRRWITEEEKEAGVSMEADVLGFHRPRAWDKIVDIEKCWLEEEPSNHIRNYLRQLGSEMGLSFYDARAQTGCLRNVIVRVTTLGQVMVIVVFGQSSEKERTKYLDALVEKFPEITSLFVCVNTKLNDFILDLDIDLYKGAPFIEEALGSVIYRIGPKSFFQTNTTQAIQLFDVVVDFAELTGVENVYDLYCGIGSIALYVAEKSRQVVGIEEVEAAIDDARINQEVNNIENAVFYAGDVKNILSSEFAETHGKPDLVITDPPRAGMHPKVIEMLLTLAAPKIVYVSCNPATQARDLQLLEEKYEVVKIQPVDMFPHTQHIESVALLVLRNVE